MGQFKKMEVIRDTLVKMIPKEVHVYANLSKAGGALAKKNFLYPYFRFVISEVGLHREETLSKTKFSNTMEMYLQIVHDFLEKPLCVVSLEVKERKQKQDTYLGICMQNIVGEKLCLYYSKEVLFLYEAMKKRIDEKKRNDFFEYAFNLISTGKVKKLVFIPSLEDRSSISYIQDNEEYNTFRKEKELRYSYRKSKGIIDTVDQENIFSFIRLLINAHVSKKPRYVYKTNYENLSRKVREKSSLFFQTVNLQIICGDAKCIITDSDLIDALEHARIIDDLWLLMHGEISYMPLQEESVRDKKLLREKRLNYIKNNQILRK